MTINIQKLESRYAHVWNVRPCSSNLRIPKAVLIDVFLVSVDAVVGLIAGLPIITEVCFT